MSDPSSPTAVSRYDWIAWGLAAAALIFVLKTHLLPALLAGLMVYSLVQLLTPRLAITSLGGEGRRWLAVLMVASAVIAGMAALGFAIASFFRASDESIPALFQRMAEIIDQSRDRLPDWLLANLPDNAEDLRRSVTEWLRVHAQSLQTASTEFLRGLAHVIIGMVVGAMLALQAARGPRESAPLTAAFTYHGRRIADSFRRVVFAQVWISAINTLLTWAYLGLMLPSLDINLPLTKTLVALTFVVGLLPIIGNLISNTAIFVVSMSQSLVLAFGSLGYLVLIHKLEYFLNARIIGGHIRARAWELLLAMLAMEAAFGISGLIIAPMAYSYFKDELRNRGLV